MGKCTAARPFRNIRVRIRFAIEKSGCMCKALVRNATLLVDYITHYRDYPCFGSAPRSRRTNADGETVGGGGGGEGECEGGGGIVCVVAGPQGCKFSIVFMTVRCGERFATVDGVVDGR